MAPETRNATPSQEWRFGCNRSPVKFESNRQARLERMADPLATAGYDQHMEISICPRAGQGRDRAHTESIGREGGVR